MDWIEWRPNAKGSGFVPVVNVEKLTAWLDQEEKNLELLETRELLDQAEDKARVQHEEIGGLKEEVAELKELLAAKQRQLDALAEFEKSLKAQKVVSIESSGK